MAVLTSTGITFSDSSALNSKYGIIPQSTAVVFFAASAPTGWTQVTTHNDKALRVVSATGAGSGGTSPFTTVFPATVLTSISATVGDTTLDINMIPSHAHPVNAGGNALRPGAAGTPSSPGSLAVSPGTTTGNNGNGGSHTHPVSGTVNLRVQYVDVIICTFN